MKIFCLGLPRTGTMSFAAACWILGYRVAHLREHYHAGRFGMISLQAGQFCEHDHIHGYDVFADIPICGLYRQLSERYRHARFILLTRDPGKWAESFGRLQPVDYGAAYPAYHAIWRRSVLGIDPGEQPQDLAERYGRYCDSVMSFFHGDSRFSVLSITDGWPAVCRAIDCPDCPDWPFPHLNAADRRINPDFRIPFHDLSEAEKHAVFNTY